MRSSRGQSDAPSTPTSRRYTERPSHRPHRTATTMIRTQAIDCQAYRQVRVVGQSSIDVEGRVAEAGERGQCR
jgi:hypothetical protein